MSTFPPSFMKISWAVFHSPA